MEPHVCLGFLAANRCGLEKMEGRSVMPRRTKETERRERMVGVHVSDDEYERLRAMAFEARKSIPALIRERILGTKKATK